MFVVMTEKVKGYKYAKKKCYTFSNAQRNNLNYASY